MIRQVIAISDLHHGCQLGLCPPLPIALDSGGYYSASPLQLVMWQWWLEFWRWVDHVTMGEPYAIIINGDTTNGKPHDAITNISDNVNTQADIALMVLKPLAEKCKGNLYFIRGTEAHVGKSGQEEERLAKSLGAIPDEIGNYARWDLWMRLGDGVRGVGKGCLVNFGHHIGTTSSMAYEGTAISKELTEAYAEAARWREEPPDILVRSHRHRYYKVEMPSDNGYAIGLTTPGWQLRTPFSFRLSSGRTGTPQIGGVFIRQGDEVHYTKPFIRHIQRSREVVA